MSVLSPAPVFKAALEVVAERSLDDLAADVALLSPGLRVALSRGPLPYRYDCAVCAAFERLDGTPMVGDEWWARDENTLPDDPRWRVWAFHEVPKLQMRFRDQLHYGPLADAVFERCLATYRAAGWEGD